MVDGRLGPVLEHIRQLLGDSGAARLTDGQLLRAFAGRRDEVAFAELLRRHGPMVLGVCRRVLRAPQDIDDAFQATFLVLVRKAGAIVKQESVASWLYGVAYRTAVRARAQRRRRQRREREITDLPEEDPADREPLVTRSLLDQELGGLPEKYRAPLVLHYLSGKTKDETARQLGWTEGTVSGRLARGRQLLRARLARRGLGLAAVLAALEQAQGAASAAVPPGLLNAAFQAGAGALFSERVGTLAAGVARGFFLTKVKIGAGLLLVVSALAAGAALVARHAPPAQAGADGQLAVTAPILRDRSPQPAPVGKDLLGDALPPGALARLGTARGRHGRHLSALELSPDGRQLATRAEDGAVRVWDAASGKELHVFRGEPGTPGERLWCFAFAPDGQTLATGGGDGMVRFWDLATGRQLRQVRGNRVGARSLAFSADGKLLAVAGEDNQVSLWEPSDWKEVRCLCEANPDPRPEAANFPVKEVRFWPDGKTLEVLRLPLGGVANYYFQSTVELWEVETGRQRRQFKAASFSRALAVTPDGKAFVRIDPGGKVFLRSADTGREIRPFNGTEFTGRTLALDADGRSLALASEDSVRLWEVSTGKQGKTLEDSAGLDCLTFARDGRTLAGGRSDGTFQLWDVTTGRKLLKPFPGHRGLVGCVAYSPDGRTLATGSVLEGTIRLWKASTGEEVRRWEAHRKKDAAPTGPLGLVFSPDGKTLVSAGSERVVRLWDVSTGKETHSFETGQEARVFPNTIRFSPDGKLLAFPDAGGVVHLWTVAGREVRRWQTPGPAPPRGG
jgi:RNA polymerase sigma factor (sigma-70 family)